MNTHLIYLFYCLLILTVLTYLFLAWYHYSADLLCPPTPSGFDPQVLDSIPEAVRKTISPWCMFNNTGSRNEINLLQPSDPCQLERTIRKEKRSSSIDKTTPPIDTTRRQTMIDTFSEALINTSPQVNNMVAPLVLTRYENGDLRNPEDPPM